MTVVPCPLQTAAMWRRAAWLCLAIASASFATTMMVVHPRSTTAATPAPLHPRSTALLPSSLDSFREEASLGNADASRFIVTQLLARYDRNREDGALIEAALWFDRDWATPAYLSSAISALLIERECDHPVLRWHWLCAAGE